MPKTLSRSGTPWTQEDYNTLATRAVSNATGHQIAKELHRTEGAVRQMASEKGILLRTGPTRKKPV